jgi:hypothetical protein
MSDSFPSESVLASSPFETGDQYALSSDLAKLCLPGEFKDSYRNLAWVNSICFLFLLVGLAGFKAPKIVVRPLKKPVEAMEVYLPPPEQPKVEPQVKQEEPEPQDQPVETPQVTVVAAAADPSAVAFPVIVEGAQAVANARFVTPPPPVNWTPPKAKVFVPGSEPGTFPQPRFIDYQRQGIAAQVTGTNWLVVTVDPSGAVVKVEQKTSCGRPSLDRFDEQWVKSKWHWLPGENRVFLVPFEFHIE